MKFKKGQICLIEDFQEFGNVLILLIERFTTNVYGEELSNPIWEGVIVDAEDKRLRDMWHYKLNNKSWTYAIALSFEDKLISQNVQEASK